LDHLRQSEGQRLSRSVPLPAHAGEAAAAVLEFFKGRIDNVLGILDKRLAGRAYVVGSEPTIADLSLVGYLYYPPEEFGFDVAANYKNIAAWLGRIKALPGWTHPYELMPGYPLPK
jgi:glutathione S-transferase